MTATHSPELADRRAAETAAYRRRSARRRRLDPWRIFAKRAGALPGALIIGAQKGGTTSLWDMLARHPDTAGSLRKETHYFNAHFHRPRRWYRTFFPPDDGRLRFEATPAYLFHPFGAERIAATLPGVRLIALLREPTARALSQYWYEYMRGVENLAPEAAFAAEEARLAATPEATLRDPRVNPASFMHFSYFARGLYARQIARCREHLPAERLLILRSEDLRADRQGTLDRICDFLGLARFPAPALPDRNVGIAGEARGRTPPALVEALHRRYAAPNAELRALTGIHWDDLPG